MHGDEKPLDELQKQVNDLARKVQEHVSQLKEIHAHVFRVEGRMVGLSEMIEDRDQH